MSNFILDEFTPDKNVQSNFILDEFTLDQFNPPSSKKKEAKKPTKSFLEKFMDKIPEGEPEKPVYSPPSPVQNIEQVQPRQQIRTGSGFMSGMIPQYPEPDEEQKKQFNKETAGVFARLWSAIGAPFTGTYTGAINEVTKDNLDRQINLMENYNTGFMDKDLYSKYRGNPIPEKEINELKKRKSQIPDITETIYQRGGYKELLGAPDYLLNKDVSLTRPNEAMLESVATSDITGKPPDATLGALLSTGAELGETFIDPRSYIIGMMANKALSPVLNKLNKHPVWGKEIKELLKKKPSIEGPTGKLPGGFGDTFVDPVNPKSPPPGGGSGGAGTFIEGNNPKPSMPSIIDDIIQKGDTIPETPPVRSAVGGQQPAVSPKPPITKPQLNTGFVDVITEELPPVIKPKITFRTAKTELPKNWIKTEVSGREIFRPEVKPFLEYLKIPYSSQDDGNISVMPEHLNAVKETESETVSENPDIITKATTPKKERYKPDIVIEKQGRGYVAPDGTKFTGKNSKYAAQNYAEQQDLLGRTVRDYSGNEEVVTGINWTYDKGIGTPAYTVRNLQTGKETTHETEIKPKDVVVEIPKIDMEKNVMHPEDIAHPEEVENTDAVQESEQVEKPDFNPVRTWRGRVYFNVEQAEALKESGFNIEFTANKKKVFVPAKEWEEGQRKPEQMELFKQSEDVATEKTFPQNSAETPLRFLDKVKKYGGVEASDDFEFYKQNNILPDLIKKINTEKTFSKPNIKPALNHKGEDTGWIQYNPIFQKVTDRETTYIINPETNEIYRFKAKSNSERDIYGALYNALSFAEDNPVIRAKTPEPEGEIITKDIFNPQKEDVIKIQEPVDAGSVVSDASEEHKKNAMEVIRRAKTDKSFNDEYEVGVIKDEDMTGIIDALGKNNESERFTNKVILDGSHARHIRNSHIDKNTENIKSIMPEEDILRIPELMQNADFILYKGRTSTGKNITYKTTKQEEKRKFLYIKKKNGYNLVTEILYPKKEDGIYKPIVKSFYPLPEEQSNKLTNTYWNIKKGTEQPASRHFNYLEPDKSDSAAVHTAHTVVSTFGLDSQGPQDNNIISQSETKNQAEQEKNSEEFSKPQEEKTTETEIEPVIKVKETEQERVELPTPIKEDKRWKRLLFSNTPEIVESLRYHGVSFKESTKGDLIVDKERWLDALESKAADDDYEEMFKEIMGDNVELGSFTPGAVIARNVVNSCRQYKSFMDDVNDSIKELEKIPQKIRTTSPVDAIIDNLNDRAENSKINDWIRTLKKGEYSGLGDWIHKSILHGRTPKDAREILMKAMEMVSFEMKKQFPVIRDLYKDGLISEQTHGSLIARNKLKQWTGENASELTQSFRNIFEKPISKESNKRIYEYLNTDIKQGLLPDKISKTIGNMTGREWYYLRTMNDDLSKPNRPLVLSDTELKDLVYRKILKIFRPVEYFGNIDSTLRQNLLKEKEEHPNRMRWKNERYELTPKGQELIKKIYELDMKEFSKPETLEEWKEALKKTGVFKKVGENKEDLQKAWKVRQVLREQAFGIVDKGGFGKEDMIKNWESYFPRWVLFKKDREELASIAIDQSYPEKYREMARFLISNEKSFEKGIRKKKEEYRNAFDKMQPLKITDKNSKKIPIDWMRILTGQDYPPAKYVSKEDWGKAQVMIETFKMIKSCRASLNRQNPVFYSPPIPISRTIKRKDLPEWYDEVYGLTENVGLVIRDTFSDSFKYIYLTEAFEELMKDKFYVLPAADAEEAARQMGVKVNPKTGMPEESIVIVNGEEYVKLPDNPKWGALSNRFILKDIRDYLSELKKVDISILNMIYKSMTNFLRNAVTTLNIPWYHIRNEITSSYMTLQLTGKIELPFISSRLRKTKEILVRRTDKKKLQEWTEAGLISAEQLTDYGIFTSLEPGNKVWDFIKTVYYFPGKFANLSDQAWRIVAYELQLEHLVKHNPKWDKEVLRKKAVEIANDTVFSFRDNAKALSLVNQFLPFASWVMKAPKYHLRMARGFKGTGGGGAGGGGNNLPPDLPPIQGAGVGGNEGKKTFARYLILGTLLTGGVTAYNTLKNRQAMTRAYRNVPDWEKNKLAEKFAEKTGVPEETYATIYFLYNGFANGNMYYVNKNGDVINFDLIKNASAPVGGMGGLGLANLGIDFMYNLLHGKVPGSYNVKFFESEPMEVIGALFDMLPPMKKLRKGWKKAEGKDIEEKLASSAGAALDPKYLKNLSESYGGNRSSSGQRRRRSVRQRRRR